MSNVTITTKLTHVEAEALAQFFKRAYFGDYRTNAASEREAYQMMSAANKIRDALAEKGFAPR